MKNFLSIALAALSLLALAPSPAPALEVAGVDVPETVRVGGSDAELVLNGAGVRKKFVIKVYVGALYLPRKANSPEAVYRMPGPKLVTMSFLYSKVGRKKMRRGWSDGFRDNHTAAEMKALGERLARFNAFFGDMHRGDVVHLYYLPGEGTRVLINGEEKGVVEGEDFYRALLRVWLGTAPADKGLKKAMLGISQ